MYFNNIFKPGALNISGIEPHLHIVLTSATAFQLIHLLVGPGLRHYVLPKKSKVLATDTSIFWWDIAMVSIAQSIVNTGVSIYLLWHSEFREGLTPQERILGYHEQTAAALAVTVGYFVFHLAQVWQNVAIEGKYMLAHSFAALYATSLAFVSCHSTPTRCLSPAANEDLATFVNALSWGASGMGASQYFLERPKATG
jgi:hypothetical protein